MHCGSVILYPVKKKGENEGVLFVLGTCRKDSICERSRLERSGGQVLIRVDAIYHMVADIYGFSVILFTVLHPVARASLRVAQTRKKKCVKESRISAPLRRDR